MENTAYPKLISQIGTLLAAGRERAGYAVNTILVQAYWQVGQHIAELEQMGDNKAIRGSQLIDRLSNNLTKAYDKGFGRSNLLYIRKLYLNFRNSVTLSRYLTWSHYYEILKADNELEISLYCRQTKIEKWSVRANTSCIYPIKHSWKNR
jgi:hypothetical protein